MGVTQTNTGVIMGYVLLFCIASVVSIMPITIGGVGLRELVFVYMAPLLGLDAEIGVALALLFFLTSLVVSMHGAVLQHRLMYYEEPDPIPHEAVLSDRTL
jgi:uncharacterized membrane protein YbhN (UPF0104 family)